MFFWQLDKWVLCKVYEKVTGKKDEDDNNTHNTQSDQRNSSTSPSVSNHDSSPRIIPNSLDVHGNHLQATISTTLNHTHAYYEPLLGSTCNFSNQSNYNMIDFSPRVVPNSLDVHKNHLEATTSTTLNHAHVYYEPLQTQHFNSFWGSTNNFPNQSPVNYNMKMTTLNHTAMSSSSKQPTHVREDDPRLEVHEINTLGSMQERQDDLSKMIPMATSSHKLPTHAREIGRAHV